MDKRKLIEAIISKLSAEMTVINQAALAAHEAATNAESKAEDQYDTRGLEASYLAGAQAQRGADLEKQISMFRQMPIREFKDRDAVAPGALVELDQNGRRGFFFLVSGAAGFSVPFEGKTVQVITPQAPLGEELIGRKVEDCFEVESQNAVREYRILSIV